ncbi:TonB-dependent receptor domain-containing protein [Dyadobacter sp. Leaf189]|uniref:TonB-dependent receptor domain-containing protein n=1 Tax=Dyadobacter sp. Leaf189 TaxID=1736295 RepID=UPI0006FD92FD|nr:TonB-dependent receptor [Dyadobacter sp. Leaf189]KQS30969.1 TonB-dependent receptor [Dyadobacter sp. Leaf189]
MKLFTLLFLGLCSFLNASAQITFGISGKVTDQQTGLPLSFSSVTLYKSSDSTLVNGVVANEQGAYQFSDIAPGTYYIQAQYIGYYNQQQTLLETGGNQVVNIALRADSRMLEEVRVRGTQGVVENKVDRQVYKAGSFLNSKGGTAVDVLRNTPSVTVNSEGAITLRGSSGFLVLINGKPVQSDPAQVLSQLPANLIENVEVITSPSARFDPDGKGGIINIVTKAAVAGERYFSANVMGGLPAVFTYDNLKNPRRFGADASFGFRSAKWDFQMSGSYLRNDIAGRRVGDVRTTIGNIQTTFPSNGERSFDRYNYTGRASLSFMPNQNNSISAGIYKGYRSQSRRADIVYNNTKTNLTTGEVVGRITYFNSNIARKTADITLGNLDYVHTFTNKSSLSISGLYEQAELDGLTTNLNTDQPARLKVLQYTRNPSENPLNAYRFRADYAVNLGKGKLEAGYQYRNQVQKGAFQYLNQNIEDGTLELVPEFSSRTRVANQIHATFVQYAGKQGKIEYAGGLRYEYSTRAFTAGTDATRHLNLSNLFPTASLQYQAGKNLRLKANYSKRVQRSTNAELNPFPEREHSETLESGDPNILPEFIDLSEIGIIRDFGKNTVFATVYNQRIKNVVNRVNSVYNDTILNRIYTNAGLATSWGIEAGTSLQLTSWWQFYAGGNVYNYKIKGALFNQDVAVNQRSIVFSVNANTSFRLAPTWNVQLTYNYLSQRVTAQGEDSRFLNPALALRKTFLKGKLSALLQWQQIDLGLLGSNKQRITTYGRDFYTTTNYIQETDMFTINLTYSLNSLAKKAKLPVSEFGEKEF